MTGPGLGLGAGGIAGSIFHKVCFVAGTQVVVAVEEDGNAGGDASAQHAEGSTATATRVRYKTVAIETLVARGGGEMGDGGGQVVLTRDQHDPTGPLVRRRITRTYQRTAYALQVLTLRDEDGNEQTLRVTEEHPFYVDPTGWTPAKSLESGDMLLGADGTLTVVANEHEAHANGVTVYNLEVEQAHTYFVLAEDAHDAAAVWVHNASANYSSPDAIAASAEGLRSGQVMKYAEYLELRTPGSSLRGHHIPQQARLAEAGIDALEGTVVVMEHESHRLTRTYKGRGRVTAAQERGIALNLSEAWDLIDSPLANMGPEVAAKVRQLNRGNFKGKY